MPARNRRLVAALVASACRSQEPPPPTPQPTPAPVVAAEPAPPERSTVDDGIIERTTPKQQIARARLELFAVVRSRSALQLFETDDGSHFVVANAEALRLPALGPVVREPMFTAGLDDPGSPPTVSWRATAFGGRWPDTLHMVAESEGQDRFRTPQVYRFTVDRWSVVENIEPPLAWSYAGFSPWKDGDTLTLRAWAPYIAPTEGDAGTLTGHGELRDRLLAKKAATFESLRGAAAGLPALHGHTILAWDSRPDGTAIALTGAQMLHWDSGATQPRVLELDPPPRDAKLRMFAGDDAYLLGADGLRHYDGKAWTSVALPSDAGVQALARTADATLWVVTFPDHSGRARLLEQRPGATWRERTLPELAFVGDAQPRPDYAALAGSTLGYMFVPLDRERAAKELTMSPVAVAAIGDALWVTAREADAESDDHWALLHTAERGPVVELPDVETMRREVIDAGPETLFTGQDGCEVFVPIAVRNAKGQHADLQRKLADVVLEDETIMLLLEVVRDRKPALGVMLPNGGEKNAVIVAALRKLLRKRMRPPICQDMVPRRELARFPE